MASPSTCGRRDLARATAAAWMLASSSSSSSSSRAVASTTTTRPAPATRRVTRVVVRCPPGSRAREAAASLARATSMVVDDDVDVNARSAIARDANGFAVEFIERDEGEQRRGTTSETTTFEGVFVVSANPARARNAAVRRGAVSASGGESCRGDAYAGCAVASDGLSARFARAGAPWSATGDSVARVVLGTTENIDAVLSKVAQSMGPDASTQVRGVFKQYGVTEFAAEDERVESASSFVSYSTRATPAIEISAATTSPYTVRAFHLELPEGCGVVYLD